jgi:hypothetical protein
MMRADEGFHSNQAGWQVGEFPPMACDDYADSSVCRVKLDPNALILRSCQRSPDNPDFMITALD